MQADEVAHRVRTWRTRNLMTREEFSRQAGIAERTLRKVEAGAPVRDLSVARIARHFPEIFNGAA
jgi:DNA-binding XRE family transcriptional regulator